MWDSGDTTPRNESSPETVPALDNLPPPSPVVMRYWRQCAGAEEEDGEEDGGDDGEGEPCHDNDDDDDDDINGVYGFADANACVFYISIVIIS